MSSRVFKYSVTQKKERYIIAITIISYIVFIVLFLNSARSSDIFHIISLLTPISKFLPQATIAVNILLSPFVILPSRLP